MITPDKSTTPALLWRLYEILAMCIGLGSLAVVCIVTIPAFLLLAPFFPIKTRRITARRMISSALRGYLSLLGFLCAVRINFAALEPLLRAPSRIIVANHPSLLDAVLLLAFLPNATCVLKAELLRNPLFGVAARTAGFISNTNPKYMVDSACAALREGAHFIIFPEAKRSRTFPISAFSRTCCVISKISQVPMQSVLLDFSTPYLSKEWGLFHPPQLPLRIDARLGKQFAPPLDSATACTELETYFRTEVKTPWLT